MLKKEIINNFQMREGDTGSTEVQIALLTARIEEISSHLKIHKKDCPNAISLQSNYAYRIIQAKWIDS